MVGDLHFAYSYLDLPSSGLCKVDVWDTGIDLAGMPRYPTSVCDAQGSAEMLFWRIATWELSR